MNEIIKLLDLEKFKVIEDKIGRSGSDVLKLQRNDITYYLKIGDSKIDNLAKVLSFLEDVKINTPKLLKSGTFNGSYYVLMTECKGLMTYELEPRLAAKVLGETLRKLHSLGHPSNILVKDMKHYKKELQSIDQEKLSEDDINFINNIEKLSVQDDLVFSHGDYCLPNILYYEGIPSLIDLDYAGVSFRYSDILDCIWSLEYNFKTDEFNDLFLKAYGLDTLDKKKVREVKNIHKLLRIKGY